MRELLDGTHIDKYGTSADTRLLTASGVHSNNGTKSTPSLSGRHVRRLARGGHLADDETTRRCASTRPPRSPTERISTLMHDPMYRRRSPGRTPPTTSRRTRASSSATAWPPRPAEHLRPVTSAAQRTAAGTQRAAVRRFHGSAGERVLRHMPHTASVRNHGLDRRFPNREYPTTTAAIRKGAVMSRYAYRETMATDCRTSRRLTRRIGVLLAAALLAPGRLRPSDWRRRRGGRHTRSIAGVHRHHTGRRTVRRDVVGR